MVSERGRETNNLRDYMPRHDAGARGREDRVIEDEAVRNFSHCWREKLTRATGHACKGIVSGLVRKASNLGDIT